MLYSREAHNFILISLTARPLDPCSDDDINNDASSLCVEIIDKNRSYYKCMICGQNSLWASLVAMLIDLLTQATMWVIKSGDSMLKASLHVQLLDKERKLNGNLKATTQMKNVGLTFSILNPSLSHINCDFWIPVYVVKTWLVQVANSCLKIILCNKEQQYIVR